MQSEKSTQNSSIARVLSVQTSRTSDDENKENQRQQQYDEIKIQPVCTQPNPVKSVQSLNANARPLRTSLLTSVESRPTMSPVVVNEFEDHNIGGSQKQQQQMEEYADVEQDENATETQSDRLVSGLTLSFSLTEHSNPHLIRRRLYHITARIPKYPIFEKTEQREAPGAFARTVTIPGGVPLKEMVQIRLYGLPPKWRNEGYHQQEQRVGRLQRLVQQNDYRFCYRYNHMMLKLNRAPNVLVHVDFAPSSKCPIPRFISSCAYNLPRHLSNGLNAFIFNLRVQHMPKVSFDECQRIGGLPSPRCSRISTKLTQWITETKKKLNLSQQNRDVACIVEVSRRRVYERSNPHDISHHIWAPFSRSEDPVNNLPEVSSLLVARSEGFAETAVRVDALCVQKNGRKIRATTFCSSLEYLVNEMRQRMHGMVSVKEKHDYCLSGAVQVVDIRSCDRQNVHIVDLDVTLFENVWRTGKGMNWSKVRELSKVVSRNNDGNNDGRENGDVSASASASVSDKDSDDEYRNILKSVNDQTSKDVRYLQNWYRAFTKTPGHVGRQRRCAPAKAIQFNESHWRPIKNKDDEELAENIVDGVLEEADDSFTWADNI